MASTDASATDRRALHWVLKIGNLRDSLQFFGSVLGMRALRSEEFASGCDATCNGPYGGRWSKTMVGYGPEDKTFALELTYNYGVPSYKQGTDLRCIGIRSIASPRSVDIEAEFTPFNRASQLAAASAIGASVTEDEDGLFVASPDGYAFKLIDDSHLSTSSTTNPVLLVSLWVSDLEASLRFWRDGLGMEQVTEDSTAGSTVYHKNAAWLRFKDDSDSPALELVELPEGRHVDHADAFGRIAFATAENPATIHSGLVEAGIVLPAEAESSTATGGQGRVIHAPVRLETPGKADVDVVILADPDSHEICLVEKSGFYELATHNPGDDFINWTARAARGGDGHPPPSPTEAMVEAHRVEATSEIVDIGSDEALASAIANHAAVGDESSLIIKVYGSWCKHCAKVSSKFTSMTQELNHRGNCSVFAQVDVDKAPSIMTMVEGGLTRVPAFLAFQAGKVSLTYVGSSERRLARFMLQAAPAPDGGGIVLSDGRVVEPRAAGDESGTISHSGSRASQDTGGDGCACGVSDKSAPAAAAAASASTVSRSMTASSTESEEDSSSLKRVAK